MTTEGDDTNDEQFRCLVEPPNYENLNWRCDAEESYSDWTIRVTRIPRTGCHDKEEVENVDTYHVHKVMIGFGTKTCGYFRTIFDQDNFKESKTSTSCIEMDPIAADAFPRFLDYIYDPGHRVALTTNNATALCYLGKYFDCLSLCWEVSKLWKKDMTISNCHVYCEHAKILTVKEVLSAVAELCAKKIDFIERDSPILSLLDQRLCLQILKARPGSQSELKSELIAKFLENQISYDRELDQDCFHNLTDEKLLPSISLTASKTLLEIQSQFVRKRAKHETETVSSLEERCVKVMVQNWRELSYRPKKNEKFFAKLSPSVLSKILANGFRRARKDADELDDIMYG